MMNGEVDVIVAQCIPKKVELSQEDLGNEHKVQYTRKDVNLTPLKPEAGPLPTWPHTTILV
jgi:hypothetical protein